MSQIRQANLKFLPVLTQQQSVIGNRCSQKNSQSLDRAITREGQTHDVDVCGAGKAYNMVAKRVSNNQFRDAKLNKRSTTVLAGPRLDCARDASLEHQQNHGAARKQGKSTLWNFFFAFFALLFFLRKITIMASVSKLFLAQTDRMGTKFF